MLRWLIHFVSFLCSASAGLWVFMVSQNHLGTPLRKLMLAHGAFVYDVWLLILSIVAYGLGFAAFWLLYTVLTKELRNMGDVQRAAIIGATIVAAYLFSIRLGWLTNTESLTAFVVAMFVSAAISGAKMMRRVAAE